MKVQASQVAGVLRNSGQFAGLLLYGEDWGLVRERASLAVRAVLGTERDPFRLTILAKEEHGRLRDEAGSLALGGGRRVVHVQEAGDALTPSLERLNSLPADALIVLEAGELTPRSKLRAYAERQQNWGAIPCYMDAAGKVSSEIQAVLSQADLSATPDALAFLSEELAGESTTRRSELEKLVLFAAGGQMVDLDTARACCSRSMDASLASAVSAALSGRPALCDALLEELGREGATGAGLLAVLSNQIQRLLKVRLLMEEGRTLETACRALLPPVYPRQMPSFMQDAERWRPAALEALGRAVRDADIACKRAASPDFVIAGRLLTTIAARSPRRG